MSRTFQATKREDASTSNSMQYMYIYIYIYIYIMCTLGFKDGTLRKDIADEAQARIANQLQICNEELQ